MEETSVLIWQNPTNGQYITIQLNSLCHDLEETVAALEQGCVCILDDNNNLLFTCFAVARVERIQSVGDLVIWPSGLAYRVVSSAI